MHKFHIYFVRKKNYKSFRIDPVCQRRDKGYNRSIYDLYPVWLFMAYFESELARPEPFAWSMYMDDQYMYCIPPHMETTSISDIYGWSFIQCCHSQLIWIEPYWFGLSPWLNPHNLPTLNFIFVLKYYWHSIYMAGSYNL